MGVHLYPGGLSPAPAGAADDPEAFPSSIWGCIFRLRAGRNCGNFRTSWRTAGTDPPYGEAIFFPGSLPFLGVSRRTQPACGCNEYTRTPTERKPRTDSRTHPQLNPGHVRRCGINNSAVKGVQLCLIPGMSEDAAAREQNPLPYEQGAAPDGRAQPLGLLPLPQSIQNCERSSGPESRITAAFSSEVPARRPSEAPATVPGRSVRRRSTRCGQSPAPCVTYFSLTMIPFMLEHFSKQVYGRTAIGVPKPELLVAE